MDLKKTITSIFLVPTLDVDKEKLRDNKYLNGYIKDNGQEVEHKDCVYLLFQPKDLDKFKEFLEGEYDRAKGVVEDYDYPNGYIVVVYKLDSKYKKDFDLVKKGRYSLTSLGYQSLFPKLITINKNGINNEALSIQYRIFNKTDDLRNFWEEKFDMAFSEDMEVWHGFDEEEETLKIEEYV